MSIFLFSSSVCNSSVFPAVPLTFHVANFQFPKSLSVTPSRVVSLSVGPLLPFEDFTISVCCPLDRLPVCRRVSLVVGLPT